MSTHETWSFVKRSFKDFLRDDCIAYGAATAFYAALSFGPLLILFLWISSMLGPQTQDRLIEGLRSWLGPQSGDAVQVVIDNATQQASWGTFAGVLSILGLLVAATAVFAMLQKAMNRAWDVRPEPGRGAMTFLRARLVSLGVIVLVFALLIASMIVNSILSGIVQGSGVWPVVNVLISLAVFTVLFAMIYKFVPDRRISWSDVWVGGVITAVLFVIGKYLIGLYLGRSAAASAYGAAGSIVMLLIWVYYSTLILLFGCELTQRYVRRYGEDAAPREHAIEVPNPRREEGPRPKRTEIPDHRRLTPERFAWR